MIRYTIDKVHGCICLLAFFSVAKEIKIPTVYPVLLTAKCYNSCAPQDDSSIMKCLFKKLCILKLLKASVC